MPALNEINITSFRYSNQMIMFYVEKRVSKHQMNLEKEK